MEGGGAGSGKFTELRRNVTGEVPPQLVALNEFVAARHDDTFQFLNSLPAAPRSIPRHMRRRARSWRPYKSKPRVGTAGATAALAKRKKVRTRQVCPEAKDEHAASGGLASLVARACQPGSADGAELRVRVRKHWRRAHVLLRVRGPVPTPNSICDAPLRWLETHIWHAKRAKMKSAWGFRLAASNNGLGRRALYRASTQSCCLHDRSYLQVFEISGLEEGIINALSLCGVDHRLLRAKHVRSGAHRGQTWLRECVVSCESNAFEDRSASVGALISPFWFLWEPEETREGKCVEPLSFFVDVSADGHCPGRESIDPEIDVESMQRTPSAVSTSRSLWLWVHPASAPEAFKCIERAVGVVESRSKQAGRHENLRLRWFGGSAFLELTGLRAVQTLARAIPLEACSSASAAQWKEIVSASASGARLPLPLGAVLALDVRRDHVAKCASPKLANESVVHPSSCSRWPENAASASGFWDAVRKWDSDDQNERTATPEMIPLLLIFRQGVHSSYLSGVDVLVPPCAGSKQLFLRCVFAEARTLGFEDRHALHTEAGIPDFPFDYPETAAGQAAAAQRSCESLSQYERRPPAKRVNFDVLSIPCPHGIDWRLVGHIDKSSLPHVSRPRILGPAPAVSDGDFVAITVVCPGRGVPQALCHLFRLGPGDFPTVWETRSETCSRGSPSSTRPPRPSVPSTPPRHPSISSDDFRLSEPLRKYMKRSRVRRRKEDAMDHDAMDGAISTEAMEPRTIRPLIGFITSGCFSYREGCGVGAGAVAALPLMDDLKAQLSIRFGDRSATPVMDLRKHWILLWARNTTSLVYFPVWATLLTRHEGCG